MQLPLLLPPLHVCLSTEPLYMITYGYIGHYNEQIGHLDTCTFFFPSFHLCLCPFVLTSKLPCLLLTCKYLVSQMNWLVPLDWPGSLSNSKDSSDFVTCCLSFPLPFRDFLNFFLVLTSRSWTSWVLASWPDKNRSLYGKAATPYYHPCLHLVPCVLTFSI